MSDKPLLPGTPDSIVYFRNEKTGLLEAIDIHTGQVLAVQSTKTDLLGAKSNRLVETVGANGEKIYLEQGLGLEDVLDKPRIKYRFSKIIQDVICQKIVEGGALTRICGQDGLPPFSIVSVWRKKFPEFAQAIAQAYADRADYYHDRAIEVVEDESEPVTKERLQQQKLQSETYRWAAQVSSERFSNRTTVKSEETKTVRLIVETGIRRAGDPGFQQLEGELNGRDVSEITPGDSASPDSRDPGPGVSDGSVRVELHDSKPAVKQRRRVRHGQQRSRDEQADAIAGGGDEGDAGPVLDKKGVPEP